MLVESDDPHAIERVRPESGKANRRSMGPGECEGSRLRNAGPEAHRRHGERALGFARVIGVESGRRHSGLMLEVPAAALLHTARAGR